MQDLPQDIIGTNPQYPPIVNHDWLAVNPQTYDNFPSDNDHLRIVPKLADLWDHNQSHQQGINLIPNLTIQHTATQAEAVDINPIIQEAKKAMMAGLKGKELASHLKARYAMDYLAKAKEAIARLSEEQGLLGNVYIDASAFSSAKDAEQFLSQHRTRLAQDIVVNESNLNPSVISVLASRFHKNVVASIDYNKDLYQKYHTHLVSAGQITRDHIIDSKESLRQAFLQGSSKPIVTSAKKEDPKLSPEEIARDLLQKSEKLASSSKLANEEMIYRRSRPIVEFACQQSSKGKMGADLKEMLRKKYATEDLQESAKYLALVVSNNLKAETLDQLVADSKISEYTGDDLKKLGKKYPLVMKEPEVEKSSPMVGVKGFFYPMSGKTTSKSDKIAQDAVEALRKGASIDRVKVALSKLVPEDQANTILAGAVQEFNMTSAGRKANIYTKAPKEKVVADLAEKRTLPDESTIIPQTQEIMGFFAGADMGVDIDPAVKVESAEINEDYNTAGIDTFL
jgi:hypothetical protein